MDIEDNKFTGNLKEKAKGFEISRFGIVEYTDRNESEHNIELRAQAYYVTGLPKYLCIIYPQGIHK